VVQILVILVVVTVLLPLLSMQEVYLDRVEPPVGTGVELTATAQDSLAHRAHNHEPLFYTDDVERDDTLSGGDEEPLRAVSYQDVEDFHLPGDDGEPPSASAASERLFRSAGHVAAVGVQDLEDPGVLEAVAAARSFQVGCPPQPTCPRGVATGPSHKL
jgi:hypothetical protein